MKVIFPNKTLTSWAVSRALSSALSLARVFWFVCFFQYFLLVCVVCRIGVPTPISDLLSTKCEGHRATLCSQFSPSPFVAPNWSTPGGQAWAELFPAEPSHWPLTRMLKSGLSPQKITLCQVKQKDTRDLCHTETMHNLYYISLNWKLLKHRSNVPTDWSQSPSLLKFSFVERMNATLHFGKYDCFIELYRLYSYTTFPDWRFYKLYE